MLQIAPMKEQRAKAEITSGLMVMNFHDCDYKGHGSSLQPKDLYWTWWTMATSKCPRPPSTAAPCWAILPWVHYCEKRLHFHNQVADFSQILNPSMIPENLSRASAKNSLDEKYQLQKHTMFLLDTWPGYMSMRTNINSVHVKRSDINGWGKWQLCIRITV